MKLKQIFFIALTLAMPLAGGKAATFTSNAIITNGDTTYDGQPMVVSNCTLTVNGPHSFASLLLTSNAVLTHSAAAVADALPSMRASYPLPEQIPWPAATGALPVEAPAHWW